MMTLFSKILTFTDVKKRLSVPSRSLRYLEPFNGNCFTSFVVTDENGREWTFRCHVRKWSAYKKPVLSSGWREFVVDKGVRQGDRITLYKDVEAEASYKIEVQRKVKLFGKEYWSSLGSEQPTGATGEASEA